MKLIKFEQIQCNPCKELKIFMEHGLGVEPDETYVLDSGNDADIIEATKFGVMSTPVLVLVDDNGQEVKRVVGINREAVEEIVEARGF